MHTPCPAGYAGRVTTQKDRIVALHVEGLRTLANVKVEIDPLAVVIGRNGTGKSSLLEAAELLRRLSSPHFATDLAQFHGGLTALLRKGSPQLVLGARIAGPEGCLEYRCSLSQQGASASLVVLDESLKLYSPDGEKYRLIIERDQSKCRVNGTGGVVKLENGVVSPNQLIVAAGHPLTNLPEILRARGALERIQVHAPLDVRPFWAARELSQTSAMRDASVIQPAERLSRFGANLPNAIHALRSKDPEHWRDTLEWIQIGLGTEVTDVWNPPDPGGGRIGLAVRVRYLAEPLPAYVLSDGMLAYIGLVAAVRLADDASLFAFDEPEAHLHPALVSRATDLLSDLGCRTPTLVATHSDRFLDALGGPEKAQAAVRTFELDSKGSTIVAKFDTEALKSWLEKYRGVGDLRAAGLAGLALQRGDAVVHR